MKISPQYVTFPVAKLLKEKGACIDGTSVLYFEMNINEDNSHYIPELDVTIPAEDYAENLCFPEQWQVVEWLRLKHNLFITINPTKDCEMYWYQIRGKNGIWFTGSNLNSPQEATEAAIEYVLTKLI